MRPGWPVGEVLGSELDLLQAYKDSRAVVRSAAVYLGSEGITPDKLAASGPVSN